MTSTHAPSRPAPAPQGVGDALRFARTVLVAVVLLAAAFVLAVAVVVPRLAGATPYTVLTPSMVPAYPPGTLVVDRPVAPEDVAIGQAITYQIAPGRPEVVTHRVVTIARHPDGNLRFQTRGDANNAVDAAWVRPEQLRGAVWYAVPHLGRLGGLLTGAQRRWGVDALAVGLLGYAVVVVVRGRRRPHQDAG